MTTVRNRVAVLHGVNFDILERRDPAVYGGLSLSQLEARISDWAHELGLEPIFFQTNPRASSSNTCTACRDLADAAIVNAGAWTHYSRAIADALRADPACRRSRSTSPTSRTATTGAGSRSSTASSSRRSPARAPTATARRWSCWPASWAPPPDARPRRPPRGAAGRARARPDAGHRPDQRPLPDRLHRHQRGLRLRARRAPLPHRLPLHRARRGRGRGLGDGDGRRRLAGGDRRAARGQGRLRGRPDGGAAAGETEGETRRRESRRSPPAAASSSCGGSRTTRSWRRSRRPRSSPTRSGAGRSSSGLAGRTEREVARAAEARIRELGGDPSFPAIVAAGPNGALPHAEPGEREIGRGELVVFDMGAQLDGYCSDGTRTFATGDPGEEARAVYEVVRQAQQAALEAIRAGVKGEDVDSVARKVIDEAGHGERLRPRARPRRRARGPRGPAPLAALRRRARRRAKSSPSSPGSTCRAARGADRGPRRRHRGRLRNLSSLPKELQLVD